MTQSVSSPGSRKGLAGRGATKEYRRLVKQIEAAGAVVRRHHGRFILTLCNTPSDHRSRLNELSRLRQAGLDGLERLRDLLNEEIYL